MPTIFLSYRRDDSAGYAGRLRSSLESRLGAGSVFRDVDTIEPGQDFVAAIEARVQACRAFLALIGQEWLDAPSPRGGRRLDEAADYVRREVAAALERDDVRVIPVLVEGAAMPAASELPDELQPLARRHAISLRDETWDSDVDRLVNAIRKVVHDPAAGGAVSGVKPSQSGGAKAALWTAAGVLAVIVVLTISTMFGGRDASEGASGAADRPGSQPTVPAGAAAGPPIDLPPEGVAVAVPRISEIELRDQIYSLVAASLVPRGDSMTLRLRFRIFNESSLDHGLFAVDVRLNTGSTTVPPATPLDGVLPGRTVQRGDVTFVIPRTSTTAVLVIADGDESGELLLDLAAGGPLVADSEVTIDDSRAVGYPMYFHDEPLLLETDGQFYSLLRISVREFANKHRIAVTVKLVNESRHAELFGRSSFRLALDDGSVVAPEYDTGDEVVEAGTTHIAQPVFEVPTTTRRVVLHLLRGDQRTEFPIELGPDARPR